MCWSRTTLLHESKKQTKRMIHAGAAKMLSKQTPNLLKRSIQGRCFKQGEGTGDNRDVHYPWGTARARCRSLRILNSMSSHHCLLCSYLYASTPGISDHNSKFPARKKFPDCLLSDLFSSAANIGTDGSRPYQPRLLTQSNGGPQF